MKVELQDYLRNLRLRVSAMTYRRKAWQIRSFANWLAQNDKRWYEVKQSDVSMFLSELHCSRAARRQIAQVIRDFYAFHTIDENPAAGITFNRDHTRRLPKVPSKAVVGAIINTLNGKDDVLGVRDLLMVELAYGSGLRRDELRKVNIDDIDFEEKTVRVTGKGNKTRTVPLTGKTIRIIRQYLALRYGVSRGPLLVSFMGRRLSVQGVYTILKERAGIRPHLLRHACATHMMQNEAGVRVVQELLGHEDMRTTPIYTAIDKRNLEEVINTRHPRRM